MSGIETCKTCLALQICEDGVLIGTVDVNLLHNLECHAIVQLTELAYLIVSAWILLCKLVAWESDDNEALVLILFIQLLQTLELRSETTLAGCVDNQQHLTFELGEIQFLTFARKSLEIENLFHCFFV